MKAALYYRPFDWKRDAPEVARAKVSWELVFWLLFIACYAAAVVAAAY